MGYYRFRLSNMMPNAWFYRLKDMSRASRSHSIPNSMKRSQPQRTTTTTTTTPKPVPPPQQSYLPNRTSYYFPRREKTENPTNSPIHPKASDTHFPADPPRKPKRRSKRGPIRPSSKLVSSSDSSGCNCGTALSSVCKSKSMPETLPYLCEDHNVDARRPAIASNTEFDGVECWSQSCNYRVTSSATDIVVDLDSRSSFNQKFRIPRSFDGVTELDLPPIITKPVQKAVGKAQLDGSTESSEQGRHTNGKSLNEHKSPTRRIPPVTRRTKIEACQRSKTAKAAKKQRNGLMESFAIMKTSSDPEREFGESMVEMIVENSIRAPKDLEELLACYLSLNSDEYHEVILKVFTEIWFELANIRF